MSVFEVFCLVATGFLVWPEFSLPIQHTVHRIVLTDDVALQDEQAALNINTFNHIRPPPPRP